MVWEALLSMHGTMNDHKTAALVFYLHEDQNFLRTRDIPKPEEKIQY